MKILKIVLVVIGTMSLIVGGIGIALPILPTTPFLIISAFCFLKGSDKCHSWFIQTKIYDKYVSDFTEKKGLSLKRKVTILLVADTLIVISMLIIGNKYINMGLLLIIGVKFWCFIFKIKTIPIEEIKNNVKNEME